MSGSLPLVFTCILLWATPRAQAEGPAQHPPGVEKWLMDIARVSSVPPIINPAQCLRQFGQPCDPTAKPEQECPIEPGKGGPEQACPDDGCCKGPYKTSVPTTPVPSRLTPVPTNHTLTPTTPSPTTRAPRTPAPTKHTPAPTNHTLAPTTPAPTPHKLTPVPTNHTVGPTNGSHTAAPTNHTAAPTKIPAPTNHTPTPLPTNRTPIPTLAPTSPTPSTPAPILPTVAPTFLPLCKCMTYKDVNREQEFYCISWARWCYKFSDNCDHTEAKTPVNECSVRPGYPTRPPTAAPTNSTAPTASPTNTAPTAAPTYAVVTVDVTVLCDGKWDSNEFIVDLAARLSQDVSRFTIDNTRQRQINITNFTIETDCHLIVGAGNSTSVYEPMVVAMMIYDLVAVHERLGSGRFELRTASEPATLSPSTASRTSSAWTVLVMAMMISLWCVCRPEMRS